MGVGALRTAVFLDRDGVINDVTVRDGVPHPPDSLAELRLLEGVREACAALHDAGHALFVVTNQPDVARGAQTRDRVEEIHSFLSDVLPIEAVATCYHDDADDCDCRKPKPGSFFRLAREHGIDLGRSFMVGDRWKDIVAGQAAGCRTILIDRDYARASNCEPDWTAPDLARASEIILGSTRK